MDPQIISKEDMTIVGMTSDRSDIHGLWMKYSDKAKALQDKVAGAGYELHRFLGDKVEVTVGEAVTSADAVPDGMTVTHVPAGQYAVFTHRLANGGYEGLNSVMENWLTSGPYEKSDNFIIEVYGERFKGGNQPDSEIDFWIPVKPRA